MWAKQKKQWHARTISTPEEELLLAPNRSRFPPAGGKALAEAAVSQLLPTPRCSRLTAARDVANLALPAAPDPQQLPAPGSRL